MRKTILPCVLIFLGILPAILGIFHSGFFLTDDGNWMVIRLSAFYEALRQGEFPVRYLPRLNNGFGYPVADFLYPLFLYLGSFIHIFHVNFISTVKLLFGISLLASSIGTFFWLEKRFGEIGAFAGALIYTLFPYHVWDITKRGSVGEVISMAIVPFIFWQIDLGNTTFSSLGIGLLILSHNTLALLYLPVIILYAILEKKLKLILYSIIVGLGLSAFFWIPAFFDLQYTVFGKTIVSDYRQYFLSTNIFILIGVVPFLIILLSIFFLLRKPTKLFVFFLILSILSLFLTSIVSNSIWQLFNLGRYVQFPFRMLSLMCLGSGFLSAYLIKHLNKKYVLVLVVPVIILLYFSSLQFFFAKKYQYYPDSYYSTNQDTTTVQNEYMPIWVKKLPKNTNQILGIGFSLRTSLPDKSVYILPKVYFPGWNAFVDSRQVKVFPDKVSGLVSFQVPQGQHILSGKFGETLPRFIADIISALSVMVFMCLVLFKYAKNKVF